MKTKPSWKEKVTAADHSDRFFPKDNLVLEVFQPSPDQLHGLLKVSISLSKCPFKWTPGVKGLEIK